MRMKPLLTYLFTALSLCLSSSVFSVTVVVSTTPSGCGGANGSAIATAEGGIPPYSYVWAPAPPTGQGTPTIGGLLPGDYTVTVTDGLGNTAQATGSVGAGTTLNMPWATELLADCMNACTGWVAISQASLGGTAPYTYDFPFPQVNGDQVIFMGVCPFGTQITATDANGCSVTFPVQVMSSPGGYPDINYILPECGGSENGVVALLDAYGDPGVWYRVYNATFDSIYEFGPPPYVITGLPSGTYNISLWDPNSPMQPGGGPVYCTFDTEVNVPTLAPPCGAVSGTVYNDADQDCTLDPTDYPLPYRVITIEPGPTYAITDGQGQYVAGLAQGSYTLSQPLEEEAQLCPANHPVPFSLTNIAPDATINLADSSFVPHDLVVSVHPNSNARPGFATSAYVLVTNTSAYPSGEVTLNLAFNSILLNPMPASGTWTIPSIAPYHTGTYFFHAYVPADITLLGTVLNYTATITNTVPEINTDNNSASNSITITGSYDPNYLEAHTSSRIGDLNEPALYFPIHDNWIEFTIHFQNTGTAAAETVVLNDLLDDSLDITSLEILGASHAFTPSFSTTDPRGLVITFNDIDLPDSTSDLLGSQGFFSYRIKPATDIPFGTLIENTADILFDFNPAIVTNTTQHQLAVTVGMNDRSDPAVRLFPNPALEYVNVTTEKVQVIDVLGVDGRKVLLPVIRRADTFQIDVRGLAPGTYVVRTASGSARFVKR